MNEKELELSAVAMKMAMTEQRDNPGGADPSEKERERGRLGASCPSLCRQAGSIESRGEQVLSTRRA